MIAIDKYDTSVPFVNTTNVSHLFKRKELVTMDMTPLKIGGDAVKRSNYWDEDTAHLPVSPPTGDRITGVLSADVLIVGAGFSGLSCAIHLLAEDPKAKVIIVERDHAGRGSSSRSAGMVEPGLLGITWTLEGAVESETDARWGFNAARRRLASLLGQLDERGIAAELIKCDNVISAQTSISSQVAQDLGKRMSDFGLETKWIDAADANTRFGTTGHGALVYEGHSVHPSLLAHSLREKALSMGAQLYEGDTVVELAEVTGKVVGKTKAGGAVMAGGCLIACGAWAGELGIKSRTAPEIVHTWMCATEKLPAEILAQAGSEQMALVAELSDSKNTSYRRVHNGRILYGNYDEPGHHVDAQVDEKMLKSLHDAAVKSMPYLKDVKIDFVWGGPILGMAHDLPFIEVYPNLPNTALVAPNGSTGVPWALLSGGMVGGIVRDDATGDAEGERLRNLLNETRMPWMTAGGMIGRAIWRSLEL
ncbi:FAD-dependent oxidoreductase [Algihabitans albus]|uniref:NAD(P)/FAD-dependent oxidoreductase n=1 Tax=Algihabitans albus TaxID=2164067 RepID=UPI0035CF9246